MKLTIRREKEEQTFKKGKRFTYKIACRLRVTDEERALLDRFDGWSEEIPIILYEELEPRPPIQGPDSLTMRLLVERGQWWTADRLYDELCNIPDVIVGCVQILFSSYPLRDQWGGSSPDGETEVLEFSVI